MTINAVRGDIYTTFKTAWGSTSPFTFDNERYDPPDGACWARVAVRHNSRQQESLGGITHRKFESSGSVFIQCFCPRDSGAAGADALAEVAQGIFEGKTINGIRFTSSNIQEIGPTEDWYMIVVEASFTYTATK